MIGTIVVLIGLCIGLPSSPASGGDAEELRLAPEAVAGQGRPVPLTGLDRSKMTDRSGWRATGEQAREFALSTLTEHRLGDDRIPNTSGSPWLILIGPDDATSQAEGQIPDELRTLIQVARYTPDDPRLERGFREHYTGGTFAILMRPDRTIAYKGLVAMTELLRQINRLLGREPEPSPWDPLPFPLPGPLNPGGGVSPVYPFTFGVLAGWLFVGLIFGVMVVRRWVARIQQALAALNAVTARSVEEPTASVQAARKPAGK